MTGMRTKGSINKATGKVEEGLGGSAQQGVGNVQDAARPR
jgi:uncharacterized protein YjbJ (UPF0337 family)